MFCLRYIRFEKYPVDFCSGSAGYKYSKGCDILITNNEKLINIENKILEIFNNNQVTSDEFQKIIDDLKKYKSKAYLIFQFLKIDDQNIDINNTREDHLFQIVGQDSDHSSILDHVTLR